ncbi:hypothetical protein MNSC_08610 [Minisyncoccus archaeophilus]|nr:MAG: hypothetical protein BWY21_00834 [Parcubacteria group bacterium ADurb.Bin216]
MLRDEYDFMLILYWIMLYFLDECDFMFMLY